jgi:tRNA U34 5-carboxymethylaminomethyl modifying GTPase MnmE/TrmE
LSSKQAKTQQQLDEAKAQYSDLAGMHRDTRAELASARADHEQTAKLYEDEHRRLEAFQTRYDAVDALHREAQTRLQRLDEERDELVLQLDRSINALEAVRDELQRAQNEQKRTAAAHSETLRQLEELEYRHEDMVKRCDTLRAQLKELDKLYVALKGDHAEQKERDQLLTRLLSAKPYARDGVATFGRLLTQDYMAFARSGSSMTGEADVLEELQSIYQELQEQACVGDIAGRALVGIVGGFSSGKSEFINSFIKDREVRLKVGLEPVTAIPTYVIAAEQRAIYANTANGGRVELDIALLSGMSSSSLGKLGFDIKALMPSLSVEVEMDPRLFGNLTLLDTPGYNAANAFRAYTASDRATALEAAGAVEAIIWVMAAEVNGTVPDSDLEFLYEAGLGTRPVYVVLSKADLRSQDELEAIMYEVEDVLRSERIPCIGISAYSSVRRQEIAYRKKSLMSHFAALNKRSSQRTNLLERINTVFERYDAAILRDIDAAATNESAIKTLRLEALQAGGETLSKAMEKPIRKLATDVDVNALENTLQQCQDLYEKLFDAATLALGHAGRSAPKADKHASITDAEIASDGHP